MKRKKLIEIHEEERNSPNKKYHLFRKHISEALGGLTNKGTWGGGHPFDVELVRMPPKTTNFPYHAHAAQWEFYIIISGSGIVRTDGGEETIEAGDNIVFPPGEAHQITNTGSADLVYYVIADNPQADVTNYPDTNKWAVKPAMKCFMMNETEYYEEED